MSSAPIVGLLLAAGGSKRFGSNKLMHLIADNRPMALMTAERMKAACDYLVVVLNSSSHPLRGPLSGVCNRFVICSNATEGLGHSLAAGVRATPSASAWLVALADMPFIKESTYTSVAESLRVGASIVAPQHGGKRGHPVGFSRCWYESLIALNGDVGAKELLIQCAESLTLVNVSDAGIFHDIDTRADLTRYAP